MKNLLIAIISGFVGATVIFTITSCTPNTNTSEEKQPNTITGVVQSIGISSGKRQDFIITIKDLKGTSHEFSTTEITYNVGDTINVNL